MCGRVSQRQSCVCDHGPASTRQHQWCPFEQVKASLVVELAMSRSYAATLVLDGLADSRLRFRVERGPVGMVHLFENYDLVWPQSRRRILHADLVPSYSCLPALSP